MITEIGIVAGDILHYLDQHKSSTLKQLVASIDKCLGIRWTASSLGVGADRRNWWRCCRAVQVGRLHASPLAHS